MTTGEYLVAHSTRPSGTALEHLLSLNIGTGARETLFTSSVSVVTSEPQVRVRLLQKKGVQQNAPIAVSRQTKHEPIEKQTFVHTGADSTYAFSNGSFEAVVISSQNSAVARLSRRDIFTRKNSKVAL